MISIDFLFNRSSISLLMYDTFLFVGVTLSNHIASPFVMLYSAIDYLFFFDSGHIPLSHESLKSLGPHVFSVDVFAIMEAIFRAILSAILLFAMFLCNLWAQGEFFSANGKRETAYYLAIRILAGSFVHMSAFVAVIGTAIWLSIPESNSSFKTGLSEDSWYIYSFAIIVTYGYCLSLARQHQHS